jgi:AraC-like DNA-binding protein
VLGALYIIAVFQAVLVAFYLVFQKKGIAKSRIILALLMVDFIVFLTGTFLLLFFYRWHHIYYAHLATLSVFLAPPLLYFYYRSLIDQHFRVTYRSLWHIVPFAIIFSIMSYVIIFQLNRNFVFRPFGMVLIAGLFIQSIFYLRRMHVEKKGAFTNGLAGKSKWFGYLFGGIIFIFVFKLLTFITWNVLGYADICIFITAIFFIFSFILINMLVLYGLFNPEQLINYFKYQSSSLNGNVKDKHFNELLALLDHKKLYLDPLLSLDKLARQLSITGKQLSQLINENAGNNFNDFINKYRIEEAQNLMKNSGGQQPNILEIAYRVGFNSKSTFNTAFKKFTNSTPSEYRRHKS